MLQLAERISEYRKIIDFRNILAHGYDSIDVDAVWNFVQNRFLSFGEGSELLKESYIISLLHNHHFASREIEPADRFKLPAELLIWSPGCRNGRPLYT